MGCGGLYLAVKGYAIHAYINMGDFYSKENIANVWILFHSITMRFCLCL